ncbi:Chemotaxis protein methyltransferase CheR [Rubellimicrobium mesophilum DSM 19309]|uniref:Chemotaxis protein methyltransferase n=1 Tax=Rubellimicrobium mesophilum DSM 19309 TaxID=442562 RepID=A0A017HLT0_9RHOB|nr:protein-glutamate O-methyltransferase [Rubellimicrobium mesophilum]EYD75093.1 Chemotaxis protein methyltransferase CheR [Rubellimicrobium mesophilum DSM 19309]
MTLASETEPRPSKARADASRADLGRLARLAHDMLGIDLQPFKSTIVHHRLASRIRELGLAGLGEYLDLLESPGIGDERDRFISAVTTNVTKFFREPHHFDTLERDVLPALVARARAGGRVRLWSAGCSSGQEPYSIAACLLALCPEAPRLDVKILATDVDGEVLDRAKRARFPAEEVRHLSLARRHALFGPEPSGEALAMREDVASLVAFHRLNLVDRWPMRQPFDAIFCRNVAIYLDLAVRERLWLRFVEVLRDGGTLFAGHSERVLGPALAQLGHAGVTTYRKRPGTARAQPSGH